MRKAAEAVFAEQGKKVGYLVGTMIEMPRAALTAGEIAETAEFFSFGTNDLTQMTFGLSRDDVPRVLAAYLAARDLHGRPVRQRRPRGRRRADEDGGRRGPRQEAEAEDRHLRRARRRPVVGRVLPRDRPRLRVLLAVPAADRAPGGGAGRAQERRTKDKQRRDVRDRSKGRMRDTHPPEPPSASRSNRHASSILAIAALAGGLPRSSLRPEPGGGGAARATPSRSRPARSSIPAGDWLLRRQLELRPPLQRRHAGGGRTCRAASTIALRRALGADCPERRATSIRAATRTTTFCCWDPLDRTILNCDERHVHRRRPRRSRSAASRPGWCCQDRLPVPGPDEPQRRAAGALCATTADEDAGGRRAPLHRRARQQLAHLRRRRAHQDADGADRRVRGAATSRRTFPECDTAHRLTTTEQNIGSAESDDPEPRRCPCPDEPYALAIDEDKRAALRRPPARRHLAPRARAASRCSTSSDPTGLQRPFFAGPFRQHLPARRQRPVRGDLADRRTCPATPRGRGVRAPRASSRASGGHRPTPM